MLAPASRRAASTGLAFHTDSGRTDSGRHGAPGQRVTGAAVSARRPDSRTGVESGGDERTPSEESNTRGIEIVGLLLVVALGCIALVALVRPMMRGH